ncbi:hypothetical protein [Streptomyces sp. NPDC049040]|uniref:hypothetical protein n=1 Tax=Streptomyces sp. NPDC049040 TaxID=3365593 RepID=UPI00371BF88C
MAGDDGTQAGRGRSGAGALWRAVVVLVVAVAAIAVGTWAGSGLVGYDSRLGMVAAVPAAFGVGLLSVLWLRARNGFIAVPLLGTLMAVLSGAQLLHDHRGVVADGAVHLLRGGMAVYEESLLAAGTVAALVSIVCAAVSGQRRPRQDVPPAEARA